MGQHGERALEPQPLHELVERLSEQRSEYTVKMKRRKAGHPRDDLELERLPQVPKDVVDGPIDSLHVVERGVLGSVRIDSQDLSSRVATALVTI